MSASSSTDKWMIRLQELEQRLKAEREARIRDRDGARQRLDEALRENDELKGALSKARSRTTGTFGTLGPLSGAFVRSFAAPMTNETKAIVIRLRSKIKYCLGAIFGCINCVLFLYGLSWHNCCFPCFCRFYSTASLSCNSCICIRRINILYFLSINNTNDTHQIRICPASLFPHDHLRQE
ncbi:hypothetical protein LIPSTDRAFT_245636 [Lipomyces starkeyi NRRL Y-11557]|uniref:Mto1-like Mto2p-binding domain-containing protein n=1 Tax=Lipomyces starkeyi NRRL Y-11557 TaxID=675824 RepID=A0A1E3Q8U5_LIPST|nr:hypothetical protein LIPSTDRAFT_245636 [Lipomyces starkeyi NRRL Y-11557]